MSDDVAPIPIRAGAAFWEQIDGDPEARVAWEHVVDRLRLLAETFRDVVGCPAYQELHDGDYQRWSDFKAAILEAIQTTKDELAAQHFAPPQSLEDWEHLARVVEKDPDSLTLHDIQSWAIAWVDREKLRLRFAANERAHAAADACVFVKPKCSRLPHGRGSGSQFRDMLAQYVADRRALYDELVAVALAQMPSAQRRFRSVFGPAAIARHWLREQHGARRDANELNRLKRAIQAQPQYRREIRPLLSRPPQQPPGWQPRS